MKHILMSLALVICGTTVGLSQHSTQNDPSYSVNNYKHSNKAATAKKENRDNSATMVTEVKQSNNDYKHQFNKSEPSEKVVVKTRSRRGNKNSSYKHPYGL